MEIVINTKKKEEIIDITDKVKEIISDLIRKEEKIVCNKKTRACLVSGKHTTCAIWLNEVNEPNLCSDLLDFLGKTIQGRWKHKCDRDNADAHIKSSLIGLQKILPIENGKLNLGTWQRIALIEFDGPRERKIDVEII